jgi:hypothetical protein
MADIPHTDVSRLSREPLKPTHNTIPTQPIPLKERAKESLPLKGSAKATSATPRANKPNGASPSFLR